jgi:hypothetical protein
VDESCQAVKNEKRVYKVNGEQGLKTTKERKETEDKLMAYVSVALHDDTRTERSVLCLVVMVSATPKRQSTFFLPATVCIVLTTQPSGHYDPTSPAGTEDIDQHLLRSPPGSPISSLRHTRNIISMLIKFLD